MERLVTIYKKKDGRYFVRQIVGVAGRRVWYKVKTCKDPYELTFYVRQLLQGATNWNRLRYPTKTVIRA